ncbi:MAG: sulfotransferase domain-containing protein [Shimia sp.]|uniref:sulfotransferase domain-containing protein n=1 Tax=Shimia sp. TaxID=1954381 RepID=UPI003B8B270F
MKSAISVSMHKAGSTIMDQLVTDFMIEKGYKLDQIAFKVLASPLSERDLFIKAQSDMSLDGAYYGVARGPYVSQMPILEKLKVLLQVRDPRDCITSAYFSFKMSHEPPKDPEKLKVFLERRQELAVSNIDEYALSQVNAYIFRLRVIKDILEKPGQTLLLTYEEMVLETESWLTKISQFLDQPLTPQLRERLTPKAQFSVTSEDARKHKRQVVPGDHQKKLKPETIDEMTERMKAELEFFGYLR